MILDVTRALAEREPSLATLNNDAVKMTKAFLRLKSRIGVIVPFERSIEAFKRLLDDLIRKKLGV